MPVRNVVQTGRYQNAGEVLRDGLRLVESREVEEAWKLETLRAAALVGVAAFDRGESRDFVGATELAAYLGALGDRVPRAAD